MTNACLSAVERATPEQYLDGLTWYQHANAMLEEWALDFECGLDLVAAAMATLSPQCPYAWNVQDTLRLLEGRGTRYAIRRNADKALQVLTTGDLSLVRGPKVTAFFHNLRRPMLYHPVTIDAWMGRMVGMGVKELARKGAMEALALGVRQAADTLGLVPNQVQAIAWIVTRGSAR